MDAAARLRERRLPGVVDVVAAARTVLVTCDSPASLRQARAVLSPAESSWLAPVPGTLHTLNTVYDGADLTEAAQLADLSTQGLLHWHTGQDWVAAFGGFAPGFMYLTPSQQVLDIARKATPRTAVPAGAVAVGGEFSAVYPGPTPGGWQLLGRCAETLWDTAREQPSLIQPGDRIRFKAVRDAVQLHQPLPVREAAAGPARQAFAPGLHCGLEVLTPGVFTTVADLGRPGNAHVGVTGSGALDRPALRRANRMVGNLATTGPGAAALELVLGGLRVRARGTQVLAVAGDSVRLTIDPGTGTRRSAPANAPFLLPDGEILSVHATPGRPGLRSVLAVRGGVDVPPVLGSRSYDVLSGLGPAPLHAGTFLPTGQSAPVGPVGFPEAAPPFAPAEATTLRFVPGPRSEWFTAQSLRRFEQQTWYVGAQSNRIGLRLELAQPPLHGGTTLPLQRTPASRSSELPSEGMVDGAIQVPPSGLPVVFLADHPVTGGYPVVGVVLFEDLATAAALAPGAAIRFTAVHS